MNFVSFIKNRFHNEFGIFEVRKIVATKKPFDRFDVLQWNKFKCMKLIIIIFKKTNEINDIKWNNKMFELTNIMTNKKL